MEDNDSMIKNVAEAINILVPYNFERVLYFTLVHAQGLSYADAAARVKQYYTTGFAEGDRLGFEIEKESFECMRKTFAASFALDDESILETIARYNQKAQYLLDPHSAVAVAAAERARAESATPTSTGVIALCTAHWCKFQKEVSAAIGDAAWANLKLPPSAQALMIAPEHDYDLHLKKSASGVRAETEKNWEKQVRGLFA